MMLASGYLILLVLLLHRMAKVIYNLHFHPLAKFPGPRLAAAAHLYEFYWSVLRDGEFIWAMERMHKKYGACLGDQTRIP